MGRKLIAGFLAVLALCTSLIVATPAEAAPDDARAGAVTQYKVSYRSSPSNSWGHYGCYDSHRDAEIAAEQLASTGWETRVEATPGAARPALVSQYKVTYRSRPTDRWGCYGSYDSHRDAEIAAEQLASTGWEVRVVRPSAP